MPRVERSATVLWEGSSARGSGRVTGATGVFVGLPVSEPARIGAPDGHTSPEELLAAAHAGCFAMSLAGELTRARTPPGSLSVEATTTLDEVAGKGHRIVASRLVVRVRVPGVDRDGLAAAVRAADDGCPFSQLIRASAQVTVEAQLERAD
jgi:osmotically inducible protein OsmC